MTVYDRDEIRRLTFIAGAITMGAFTLACVIAVVMFIRGGSPVWLAVAAFDTGLLTAFAVWFVGFARAR